MYTSCVCVGFELLMLSSINHFELFPFSVDIQEEANEIIRSLQGHSKLKYSKAVKEFAFTLHYYSPRAYRYLRRKFSNNLPSESALQKWYSNSDANGEPGISCESISILKNLVEEANSNGRDFYCSLSFDEMNIRRNVQFCAQQKKFSGFITYGETDEDELPVARFAIVFMVTDLSTRVSFPIAHHFIKCLNGPSKADLIETIIIAIAQTKATLVSITCDGYVTNLSAFKRLGAKLNAGNLNPVIRNPLNNSEIHILFYACHMLKLVRNCLYLEKTISDHNNNAIKWELFENLAECRVKNDFVTHKITRGHVECNRNKMKVALPSELLSRSAAKSLAYLMSSEQPGFQDSSGTIEFILKINDLFDILNTGCNDTLSNNNNNLLKTPMCADSAPIILPSLDECVEYIEKLRLKGSSIVDSKKKMGFIGFLVDIMDMLQPGNSIEYRLTI